MIFILELWVEINRFSFNLISRRRKEACDRYGTIERQICKTYILATGKTSLHITEGVKKAVTRPESTSFYYWSHEKIWSSSVCSCQRYVSISQIHIHLTKYIENLSICVEFSSV